VRKKKLWKPAKERTAGLGVEGWSEERVSGGRGKKLTGVHIPSDALSERPDGE